MARQILILAKSITEANSYAKLAGLQRYTYRAVGNAGQIKGTFAADVHVLPGFLDSPGRHSILDALRWARTLEVFYVDPADFLEPAPETRPEVSDRLLEVAYRYNALRGADADKTQEPTQQEIEAEAEIAAANAPAPVEKPKPAPRKPRAPKPAPTSDLF